MSPDPHKTDITQPLKSQEVIAVVGSGPVGVHFVNELYRLDYPGTVLLFGDEPHAPYNRVKLSNLLDGSCDWQNLVTEVRLKARWQAHYHTQIVNINRDERILTDNQGNHYPFDKLVLATGSKPHIPAIPGNKLAGVFAFRKLEDAEKLLSRQVSSRHTIVIGGGLLGIETARAMAKYGTDVTLIHHSPMLMNRQLDERSSELLVEDLRNQRVEVRLSSAVLAIDGSRKVEKIMLRGEPAVACDTVIFATGIKPNSLIAREAGIAVGQGVKINNRLETNQADIFAIGECAEFNGRIFGLVAPGLEQAGVLARNLACDDSAVYKESLLSANLKVVRTPVFSTGEVGEDYSQGIYKHLVYDRDGIYRKLVLSRGRLVGAIALGDWPEQDLIKAAIGRRAYLLPLRQWLFKSGGALFSDASDPTRVPDQAIICNCRQIPAGDIRSALSEGCQTVEAIGLQCGAGTVCGSCQPILATFTQQNSFKAKSQLVLATWGLAVAALIAAFFLLPPLPIAEQYNPQALDKWWTETDHRQITGFTTLGMMSLGLLVGLRKRIRWFRWLKFDRWRWLHVILSTLCLGLLFVHTGLGSAQGLNRWLLWSFMLAAAMGVGTSVLSHLESRWPGIANKTFKRWFTTAHLASFWPMPVLLALHILTVYWF